MPRELPVPVPEPEPFFAFYAGAFRSRSLRYHTSTRLSLRPKVVVNAFLHHRVSCTICAQSPSMLNDGERRQLSPEVVVTPEPPSVSSEFEEIASSLRCIPDLTSQIIRPPQTCWRQHSLSDVYKCTWNLSSGSSPVCTRQSAPTTNDDKHHRWQSSALGLSLRTSRDSHAK